MFKYKVTELTFSGGETINLDDADVVIFVGANNVGKSRALSDIGKLIHKNGRGGAITRLKPKPKGNKDELMNWLKKYYITEQGALQVGSSSRSGIVLIDDENGTVKIEDKFILRAIFGSIGAEDRLSLTKPTKGIDFWERQYTQPIHLLQKNSNLRQYVSSEVKNAFNIGIVPEMKGQATEIRFRVGDEPKYEDRMSSEYQGEMRKMPMLDSEGHGVRGFVGCLLSILPGQHKLIVIDEPELFLHPPQARRLGRLLSETAKDNGQQIVIATHSPDIIQGVLDGTDKTTIIRINRDGNKNHAFPLHGEDIKNLWKKPILRSSGAISGLFHEGVIVCEADADVRFYESLMQRLDSKLGKPADFYFVHGGGKGELATLSESYTQLQIPTVVIADFDMLRNKKEMEKLIKALKGNFAEIEKLYDSVSKTLDSLGSVKKPQEVIEDMQQFLVSLEEDGEITNKHKERLSNLLADASNWSEAKKYGITKLRGGAYRQCQELLVQLQTIGLFIISDGEMESWDRSLPANKNQWILEALELIDSDDNSFLGATDFMEQIANYLWNK